MIWGQHRQEQHQHQHQPPSQQQQQIRFKHSAKMGQHLERLDDMAHESSRQEAQERRQKKKDKKAAKKGKNKNKASSSSSSEPSNKSLAADELFGEQDAHDESILDDDEDDDEILPGDEEGSVLPNVSDVKDRMMNMVGKFTESLKAIRGAEPTPELFDEVMVQAYGASTPLKSVAQVVIASPTLASATCFDPAVAKDVSNALRDKLGLNPSVQEGGVVRIPIPRVSMESRQKTAVLLGKRTETGRQKIRNLRRKVMDVVKKGVAGKLEGISKDDAFRVQKEIESVTEEAIQKLNVISNKKQESIMAV